MEDKTAAVIILGLGLFSSLIMITFLLTRANSIVSFTRDSQGRITEIMERAL